MNKKEEFKQRIFTKILAKKDALDQNHYIFGVLREGYAFHPLIKEVSVISLYISINHVAWSGFMTLKGFYFQFIERLHKCFLTISDYTPKIFLAQVFLPNGSLKLKNFGW